MSYRERDVLTVFVEATSNAGNETGPPRDWAPARLGLRETGPPRDWASGTGALGTPRVQLPHRPTARCLPPRISVGPWPAPAAPVAHAVTIGDLERILPTEEIERIRPPDANLDRLDPTRSRRFVERVSSLDTVLSATT